MRIHALLGAVLGAGLLGGGIAYAAKRKPEDEAPYFVYVVQPGDTLGELALKFLGDAGKSSYLYVALENMPDSDKQVPVGAKIRVPCVWVTVQKGDTLASIAERVLGDGKRWRRILEANRNASSTRLADPDKLAVGQRLAVPLERAPGAAPPPPQKPPPLTAVGCDLDLLEAERVGCP